MAEPSLPSGPIDDPRRVIRADDSFVQRLRRETAGEHRALERVTGLAPETMDRKRVAAFLEAMYAFHVAWESWAATSSLERGLLFERRKSGWLARDLTALGLDPASISVYPGDLGQPTEENVLGSLYVTEGATLGGRVMRRWLCGKSWLPQGGFHYFNAHGAKTGSMWRQFQEYLTAMANTRNEDAIILSARTTFRRLSLWLGGLEVRG